MTAREESPEVLLSIPARLTSARSLLALSLATLACLIPFINRAYNIDDPLFLWAAKNIQSHPLNFYGFSVNWIGAVMPMTRVMFNPPLTSYFIALAAAIAGWREISLHLAFLIPALAAIAGSYFIAKRFCASPLVAALATLLTPAFLVSATTVMSDVMLLAFWVWAIYFWIVGLEARQKLKLFAAACVISGAILTKYFGVSLVPLLFAYSLARERRLGQWALFLIIPLAVLGGYELLGVALYGKPLFIAASHFSVQMRSELSPGPLAKLLMTFSFAGGGALTALLFFPLLWSRRGIAAGIWLGSIALAGLFFVPGLVPALHDGTAVRWTTAIQLGIFVVAGLQILLLAALDFRANRDAQSLILLLWICGTLVFSAFFNWAVDERSILPIVPAVGILIARRLERNKAEAGTPHNWRIAAPLVLAAGFSLLLSWSDYRWANSQQVAAKAICEKLHCASNTVWVDGHWGFQYYMQNRGAVEVDWHNPQILSGQPLILARNNAIFPIPKDSFRLVERIETTPWKGLATMNRATGAGYYSDQWGPLPFELGFAPPDKYLVLTLR